MDFLPCGLFHFCTEVSESTGMDLPTWTHVPSWLAYGQRGSGDEVPLAQNRHWDEQWAGQGENMMPLLQAQLPWA